MKRYHISGHESLTLLKRIAYQNYGDLHESVDIIMDSFTKKELDNFHFIFIVEDNSLEFIGSEKPQDTNIHDFSTFVSNFITPTKKEFRDSIDLVDSKRYETMVTDKLISYSNIPDDWSLYVPLDYFSTYSKELFTNLSENFNLIK